MLASVKYHIKGMILEVSNKGLVVQVQQTKQQQNQNQLSDLPEWMFYSPSAIWFADGDNSMYDRAMAGEQIKMKLLSEMPPRNYQNTGHNR
jgi:hypothetical protein